MTLEIISPEATLYKGDATSVTAPGVMGSFQILENHAAMVFEEAGGGPSVRRSGHPCSFY